MGLTTDQCFELLNEGKTREEVAKLGGKSGCLGRACKRLKDMRAAKDTAKASGKRAKPSKPLVIEKQAEQPAKDFIARKPPEKPKEPIKKPAVESAALGIGKECLFKEDAEYKKLRIDLAKKRIGNEQLKTKLIELRIANELLRKDSIERSLERSRKSSIERSLKEPDERLLNEALNQMSALMEKNVHLESIQSELANTINELKKRIEQLPEKEHAPERLPEPKPVSEKVNKPKDGYEIYPDGEYDFYGIAFNENTKERFLDIRFGEFTGTYGKPELLPDGYSRQGLTLARRKMINGIDLANMAKISELEQAKFFFGLSEESQIMLYGRLEESFPRLIDGTDFDGKLNSLMKNVLEWQTIFKQYFQYFLVNRRVVWRNSLKEAYYADDWGLSKESVDKWERYRIKWLDMLPNDIKAHSFYEIPEYIIRADENAWVDPETHEVVVRKPKVYPKPEGELLFEEEVRYMDKILLDEQYLYYQRLKEEADTKKLYYEKRELIARAESMARSAKYNIPAKAEEPTDEERLAELAKLAERMGNEVLLEKLEFYRKKVKSEKDADKRRMLKIKGRAVLNECDKRGLRTGD